MSLAVLYSFRRCPYAMRARLALSVAQQPCELREVVLRNKPAALLEASPKGTVPVLVLGETVIDESLDIMLWALEQADPEAWLQPEKGDRASMLALIAENDTHFKQALDKYKYPNRHAESADMGEQAYSEYYRAQAGEWLLGLEQRLMQNGGFLFGSRRCMADMAILPFVRQFAHTDNTWFSQQVWPNLDAWLQNFLVLPRFLSIMQKYEAWTPESEAVPFPLLEP